MQPQIHNPTALVEPMRFSSAQPHRPQALIQPRIKRVRFVLPVVLLALLLLFQPRTYSQAVDLGIGNILQEKQAWCWAAAAQQIIVWLNGQSPYQCQLVSASLGQPSGLCCTPGACDVPGNLNQIRSLIQHFGGAASAIAPPANPTIIFNALQQGKAIILFLQTTPYIGHFVVLRGMAWINGQPVFYINDPMSYFTQPVYFSQLVNIWAAAIVVYRRTY